MSSVTRKNMAAIVKAYHDTGFTGYVRPDHGHMIWGEQVKAVILLREGYEPSEALAQEILDFARRALPSFKVPRSLDFVTSLPRSEAGKIQRNKVRAPYWEGRKRQI
mgnify:CR=1 FL=1